MEQRFTNEQAVEHTYCVYMHTNMITNKRYIGQTKYQDNPEKRWQRGKRYKSNPVMRNAIKAFPDWDFDWVHEILERDLTAKEANRREKYWIEYYQTNDRKHGYNIECGGKEQYYKKKYRKPLTKEVEEVIMSLP